MPKLVCDTSFDPGQLLWALREIFLECLAKHALQLFLTLVSVFNNQRCHLAVSNWIEICIPGISQVVAFMIY